MKVVVTGARGLIGWHASARLHAENCAAAFKGDQRPYELVQLGRVELNDPDKLRAALQGADAVLHFAGVNRGSDEEVEQGNISIAETLAQGCNTAQVSPNIVYANSTHAGRDNPYGRSKQAAAEILSAVAGNFTNLILPHIFGECARPFYNNVTATLITQLIAGEAPTVNPDGRVSLLHAGAAAQLAIDAALAGKSEEMRPAGVDISIPDLLDLLQGFHASYQANVYPDLNDPFHLELFNCYRAATYPSGWPRPLKLNSDARGVLFEAVKGGGGGQTFLSTTELGVTRGDHFHLEKVERFLVVQGDAIIRIRKVLSDDVWEYKVSGDAPAPVDMPTLHTHSIENVGEGPLLTLFWTHDLFDPNAPDTFADKVLS